MIGLIVLLVVVGVCLYMIENFVPMDATIKMVIRVVVVLCMILYLINAFGIVDIPLPRVR